MSKSYTNRRLEERETFPMISVMRELMEEQHLIIADHTRKYLKSEITFPGKVVDRTTEARFLKDGDNEVARIVADYKPSGISRDSMREIVNLMKAGAKKFGQEELPEYE